MHSNELDDRFSRDVDRLLAETEQADAVPPDADYREDLVLAAELAATDFSGESTRRESLRRELLTGRASSANPLTNLWRRHPRLATAAAAAAVVLVAVAVQPDLRASVILPVIKYVKQLVLGDHTRAVVSQPLTDDEVGALLDERARQLEAGEIWSIETAAGRLGGDVPAGRDPVLVTYFSLGRAEADAAFPFATPADLPEGFRFDRAVLTPDDGVLLWYHAPGRRITLYQRPVRPDATTMAMATGAGSQLEGLTVNGVKAAWMNGQKLVWEAGGVSYDLEGSDWTLEEALAVARTLD